MTRKTKFNTRLCKPATALTTIGLIAGGWTGATLDAAPAAAHIFSPQAYEIPPGSVADALNLLADESGAHLVYDAAITRHVRTLGVSGKRTLEEALRELLTGTGLAYEIDVAGNRVTIVLAQAGGTMSDASGPMAEQLPPIDIGATPAQPREGAGQPPITKTTAGPVRGYQALTARPTRMDTPIRQLPLSVQVVPRKLIDDQSALSQSEAFTNISGVQPLNPFMNGQSSLNVRGMTADRYTDGLSNYYDFGARDLLVNVERIEVLKGPISILFQGGPGSIGGVVNVVSKLPTPDRFAEAGVRAGGYSFVSPYVDINQPLTENKSVLFRFTGQFESRDFNVETVHRQSYTINPTLTLTNNAGTSLTVQGNLSRRDQQDYAGLPATGTIDTTRFTLRRDLFLSNKNVPLVSSQTSGVTLRFDHAFDEVFSHFTTMRFSSADFFEPYQVNSSNTPASGSSFSMSNGLLESYLNEFSMNSNMIAKFDLGPTENRVLVGGDFNRVWDKARLLSRSAGTVDLLGSVFPTYDYPPTRYTAAYSKRTYQNSGVTAQIQSTLFTRLHVLAAFRYAMVDMLSRDGTTNRGFESTEAKFLPRVGAVFDVNDWLSVYGSYAEGLRPIIYFSTPGDTPPLPEGSKQFETGVKLDNLYGLSGTLAWFDLKRTNVATYLPNTFTQVQTGEQHSQGVEADLVWQPTANLSFLASYAHTEARVSRDENYRTQGARLANYPRNTARLWAHYAFDGPLQGFSVGAGFYAVSSRLIQITQPWSAPGHITFDANLAYKFDNFTVSVAAKNVFDSRYYDYHPYFSGRVTPGEGRTFYATVSGRI
jgi:iron complex outermembrane receptor protein